MADVEEEETATGSISWRRVSQSQPVTCVSGRHEHRHEQTRHRTVCFVTKRLHETKPMNTDKGGCVSARVSSCIRFTRHAQFKSPTGNKPRAVSMF